MITKKKFIETYAKHPPKKWIKFAFKYFSKETEAKNMKLSNSITWILGILFLFGLIGSIFNIPTAILAIVTYSFSAILATLVIFLMASVLCNNKRIKTIAKELDISIVEYNKLVDKWGDELK
jgi:hypothetical protein